MKQRLDAKEWMDLGNYSPEEYSHCLHLLDRVGRLLGGDKATFRAFKKLKNPPTSILDVGCGGGLFTIKLAEKYPKANIVGIDIAPEAIEFANRQLKEHYPHIKNLEFVVTPTPNLQYPPKSFDVVTSTLVCHHLSDAEIVLLLKDAHLIASKAIILNDLHRNIWAKISYACISPILFRNKMVIHDGLLSIQRAFIRKDWMKYFKEAEISLDKTSLTWHWAFRWIAFINTSCDKHV